MFRLLAKPAPTIANEGIVTKIVYPNRKWRVQYEATEWFAVCNSGSTFEEGDFVRVVGRVDATTLLIEPTD